MKSKNAKYTFEIISVLISCHQCNRRFESPDGSLYWGKGDIGRQMHEEMICPNCRTVNKLPEKLINTAAGF